MYKHIILLFCNYFDEGTILNSIICHLNYIQYVYKINNTLKYTNLCLIYFSNKVLIINEMKITSK